MRLPPVARLACCLTALTPLAAEPLSRTTDIDFFRDVPSRNLHGFATRSDGRLVAGPVLTELAGPAPADLLWCLEATPDPAKWLVGTGPDGKILELTLDPAKATYASREIAALPETQIFSLRRLPDGSILAGSSPRGGIYLVREGKVVARVGLPVDSIFDLLLLDEHTALAATGNPGRIYRLDLAKFAAGGVAAEKVTDATQLAAHGITLFGEIRDRNVRRLVALADGRIAAGSAPRGNLYTFPRAGGAPVILQENREAEVTDLLPQPNGDLYATIVFAGTTVEARIGPGGKAGKEGKDEAPATPLEKFTGRSSLLWFPAGGFPETLTVRNNVALYRLARHGDLLIGTGGDQGELLGFDLKAQLALTFAGSTSAQVYGLAALAGQPGRYVVLRNNAPGVALLDLTGTAARSAETRRLDLGVSARLGALRFNRVRHLADAALALEMKTSNGIDEVEGWTPWTPLQFSEGGWSANTLRGHYAKLRVSVPAGSSTALELDKAELNLLPQNRRPQLQDFRLLAAGYGLLAAPEPPPSATVTLGQLLQGGSKDAEKTKNAFLTSAVVPQPGAQLVLWTVSDPDGDRVLTTFSIRRDGDAAWTDLAVNTHEAYAQFDTSHLPEGLYFTRLVATETAPRPPAERLSATFETDDLMIDHTPPEILDATVRRDGEQIVVTVHGRDALSLLEGLEGNFNNGLHEQTDQPRDGIRDSREETFTLEIPLAKAAGATSVEILLYDAAGNSASRRLTW
jgi:hypothetical protein